jgi:hypothetical protein
MPLKGKAALMQVKIKFNTMKIIVLIIPHKNAALVTFQEPSALSASIGKREACMTPVPVGLLPVYLDAPKVGACGQRMMPLRLGD